MPASGCTDNYSSHSRSWSHYYYSVKFNEKQKVLQHLSEGKDPRITIDGPLTSLDLAAKHGHSDLVSLFLKFLRLRTKTRDYAALLLYPATQEALDNDHIPVLKVLLEEARVCLLPPLTVSNNREEWAFCKEVLYYDGVNDEVMEMIMDTTIFNFPDLQHQNISETKNFALLKRLRFVPNDGAENWIVTAILRGTEAIQLLKYDAQNYRPCMAELIGTSAIATGNVQLLEEMASGGYDSSIRDNIKDSISLAMKHKRIESLHWLMRTYEIQESIWEQVSHKRICKAPMEMATVIMDKKANLGQNSDTQLGILIHFACAYNRPDVLDYILKTYDHGKIHFMEFNFLVIPCYTEILHILLESGLYGRIYGDNERRERMLKYLFEAIISDVIIRFERDYCGRQLCPKNYVHNEIVEDIENGIDVPSKSSFLLPPLVLETIMPLATPPIPCTLLPGSLYAYFRLLLLKKLPERSSSLVPRPPVHCSWPMAAQHALVSLKTLAKYDPIHPELVENVNNSSSGLTTDDKYLNRVLLARRFALNCLVPWQTDCVSEFLSAAYFRSPKYSIPYVDEIVRDGLLSMAGSGVQLDRCLHFLTSEPGRRKFFSVLIQNCGLAIEKLNKSLVPIACREKIPKDLIGAISTNGYRRLPLASQCRLAVLRRLRQNQDWNLRTGSHDLRYSGKAVYDLVDELRLPVSIRNFLKFDDMRVLYYQCFKS